MDKVKVTQPGLENVIWSLIGRDQGRRVTNQLVQHPTTLSLFSGAGGLDIGFHKAGFRVVACVEIDKAFCQTLEFNLGKSLDAHCQIINADIRQLIPEDIIAEHIDFIIGGPPCQSFSAIGRRVGGIEGALNARGSLFEHYCRLVKHFQPKGFLFENVRGILGSNQGKDWERIVNAFAHLGYQLSYRVLDTADYGVPQHRERLIMVGTQTMLNPFKFPRPTQGPDSPENVPYVSALQAIADLQDPSEPIHRYGGKYGALLEEIPPGHNYHYFTKEMGHPEPRFAWRSRFSDFLYKADPDKPVRTIVAKLGAYSGPFHWKNRKFNLEEFKRLQTFPDDYEFAGGLNSALQQIGNSVPPVFAEYLAHTVLQQLFGVPSEIELLEADDRLSFDQRKSGKAQATRSRRIVLNENGHQHAQTLFEAFSSSRTALPEQAQESHTTETFLHYLSSRQRMKVAAPFPTTQGSIYRITAQRDSTNCTVYVSSYDGKAFSEAPLLQYVINFHHPIGNGLERIECTLFSKTAEDIPVVWDAIEDCLSTHSAYQTMMDVYGHFTEPHPMFDLDMEILTQQSSFLLRFAEKFSGFPATSKIMPARILQELYRDGEDEDFNLAEVARALRELRFDVRVNETNPTIPSGYFRCCYPFTINIDKQVSVTWKERLEEMPTNKGEYAAFLSKAFNEAKSLLEEPDVDNALQQYSTRPALSHQLKTMLNSEVAPLHKSVAEGIETLVGNLSQSKYLFSILITGLVEKLVHTDQDIRYTQEKLPGGYSNRSTDQICITPFLQRYGLTSCAKSGAESGRNFERPFPHTLDYSGVPRGRGSKEAYLGIVHAVQEEGIDPFPCIVFLMALDLRKKAAAVYNYPQPRGLTIQEIVDAVLEHYREAKGNGRARIPVLAIQAIYQCLVNELARFKGTTLRNPPNRHTGNDKKGWIGDIQVDRADSTPFEAVEVKAGQQITSSMVRALPTKFRGQTVNRYYILSTESVYIAEEEREDVNEAVREIRQQTGCQVIVNGLNRSLWYYLRMIENTDLFLEYYTFQVQNDQDTKNEHRKSWASILARVNEAEVPLSTSPYDML
jgi:DNA (cytosine-5)-methyltransferase 1